jgi:hypothetical protein
MGIVSTISFQPFLETEIMPAHLWIDFPPESVCISLQIIWETKEYKVDLFTETTLSAMQTTCLDFLCDSLEFTNEGAIQVRQSSIPRFFNQLMIDTWRIPMIKQRMVLLAIEDIRNKIVRPTILGYYQPSGMKRISLKAIEFMKKGWKIGGKDIPFVLAKPRIMMKDICCICHQKSESHNEKIVRFRCKHEIHIDCFTKLLEHHQGVLKCPLCRKEASFYTFENQKDYLENIFHKCMVYNDITASLQVS